MDFEDVFSSKIRIKILKLLSIYDQITPSEIAEKLRICYGKALNNLELLEKEDVTTHYMYGRIRYFKFTDSTKAKAIKELLNLWTKF